MEKIISTLTSGVHFETAIRDHTIMVDGPAQVGGKNAGPTPPELVAAALGTCVGIYAVMFCQKHGISTEGMTIETEWEKAENPQRIGRMAVKVALPAGIPADKYDGFMKTVEQCMVHNTLCHMPEISVDLAEPVAVGGGCCCCRK